MGTLELRVPQERQGRFSTELFERYQRSEKALVAALAEMYVQGVSTRKVKAVTEELCGHAFSASAVSAVTRRLDGELARFARRRLEEPFAYLWLDARYEKVREEGVVRSQAVQVAIGINGEGRRCVLAGGLANRESATSWREFLVALKQRGLRGVELVVSDDHSGLKKAIEEVLPESQPASPSKLPRGVRFQPAPELNPAVREINLIGEHAAEAVERVEKFLDAAVIATAARVRIVHGHGMGILKRAVQDMLRNNPHVEKFYPASQHEGGSGATIVELKE